MLEIATKDAITRLKDLQAVGQMRGRDRKKVGVQWAEPETVWEDKDHTLYYLTHPFDLAALGILMRHCSGTHWVWATEEKVWQFFALVDKASNVPHVTVHAKDVNWYKAGAHPRDGQKNPSVVLREAKAAKGKPDKEPPIRGSQEWYDWYHRNNFGGGIPLHCGSSYATYYDTLFEFEQAGIEYEPGKYGPINYACNTYDYNLWSGMKSAGEEAEPKFPKEPEPRYSEAWYRWYDANVHPYRYARQQAPKLPMKFDDKHIVILSVTAKGQVGATKYEDYIQSWYNEHVDEEAKAVR
jgi:hypothetical protein